MKDGLFKDAEVNEVLDEGIFRIIAQKYCRMFNSDFNEIIKGYKLADDKGKRELIDNLSLMISLGKG